jgi:hypothetical protein
LFTNCYFLITFAVNGVIECEQGESDREWGNSMTNPMRRPGGRGGAALLGAFLLLAGAGLPVLLSAGPAQASGCSAVLAGTNCTLTGTLTLSAGTLTETSSGQLGWSGTLNGLDQYLVDTSSGDQSYLVNDASGSGAGWHMTVSATQFTTGGGTPALLNNSGTFSTNGSTSLESSTNSPTAACSSGATCTLPSNGTTYPVAITTGGGTPTAYTIYDTAASSGLGSITVGIGANPVGWWLFLPANTLHGTYTSTVTLELISAP